MESRPQNPRMNQEVEKSVWYVPLKFLRHVMRAIWSVRPKCSHRCVSGGISIKTCASPQAHATRISKQTSMRAKWLKHIAIQTVQEHILIQGNYIYIYCRVKTWSKNTLFWVKTWSNYVAQHTWTKFWRNLEPSFDSTFGPFFLFQNMLKQLCFIIFSAKSAFLAYPQ